MYSSFQARLLLSVRSLCLLSLPPPCLPSRPPLAESDDGEGPESSTEPREDPDEARGGPAEGGRGAGGGRDSKRGEKEGGIVAAVMVEGGEDAVEAAAWGLMRAIVINRLMPCALMEAALRSGPKPTP